MYDTLLNTSFINIYIYISTYIILYINACRRSTCWKNKGCIYGESTTQSDQQPTLMRSLGPLTAHAKKGSIAIQPKKGQYQGQHDCYIEPYLILYVLRHVFKLYN